MKRFGRESSEPSHAFQESPSYVNVTGIGIEEESKDSRKDDKEETRDESKEIKDEVFEISCSIMSKEFVKQELKTKSKRAQ